MGGEERNTEYKLRFATDNPEARTKLVKCIVAMANTGGGQIIFGRSETQSPGIDPDSAGDLYSAKITDLVERYVERGLIQIGHHGLATVAQAKEQHERVTAAGLVIFLPGGSIVGAIV